VTSCSASDFQCLCTNSAFIDLAVHCIADTCSSSDAQNAYTYCEYACSSVGVTVPSVDSVLSTPDTYKSGTNSSPPPAPPAPAPAPEAAPTSADPPAPAQSSSTHTPADSASPPAPAPAAASDSSSHAPAPAPASGSPAAYGTPTTSPMVTFQGSSANAVGVQRGLISAAALGVVAIVGAGFL